MGFTLTTTAFKNNQFIPIDYTCQGKDSTPLLHWSDPPKGTQSFTIIMDDPDSSALWVHWVVFNIPANINQWPSENIDKAIDGNNSWAKPGYGGPCPPAGKDHHYVFVLYALDTFLNLPKGSTAAQVREALKGHVLEQTQIIGLYRRS